MGAGIWCLAASFFGAPRDGVDTVDASRPEGRRGEAGYEVDTLLGAVGVGVRLLGVREVDHHIGEVDRRRARHAAAAKKVGHLRQEVGPLV